MHETTIISRARRTRLRRLACALVTLAAIGMAGLGLSAAPVLADSCPNEQLRAENNSLSLPECRAYELVSSAFKEGFAPGVEAYADDGALAYKSYGNFAENGLGSFNQYLATRSAASWQTVAPTPHGPAFAEGSFAFGLSTDLRSEILQGRRSGQPDNVAEFYLREPDGNFSLIGPGVNPAKRPPAPPGTTYLGGEVRSAGASANLSHMLFTLDSAKGYPGDTSEGSRSLYEYVGTGNERPQLVGVDNEGHQLSQRETCANGISPDGRVVFFTTDCQGGNPRVWARINEATTIEASASECARTAGDPGGVCNAPADASFAGAATDGSRVFLTTTQQLLDGDTDETTDLYACDIPPGTPVPVGTANPCSSLTEVSHGATAANVQNVVRVSDDGSRAYFVAKGVLASNLGTNDATAVAGDNNLYVSQLDAAHPAGQTTFVSKLQFNDIEGAQATADGRYLVFTTANQLLPNDTDEAQDVYRYDADTGTLLRLSTDTSGTGGNDPTLNATTVTEETLTKRPRTIMTADAGTVVFVSSEALAPPDTNGQPDVYAWHNGQVSLISSGKPDLELPFALFAWITASGTDIFFNATAQLTPHDGDTNMDIYDARVGGGFSFAQPPACSGETCQGAVAPAPPMPAEPTSSSFNGAGNPIPALTAPAVEPPPKSLTRAQKLSKALKACKSRHNRKKRSMCEKKAHRSYGRPSK